MLNFGNTTPKKEQGGQCFVWTGNEVPMFLETTTDFNAKKSYEGVDWESVKGKHIQILSIFITNLLQGVSREDFQHSGYSFT